MTFNKIPIKTIMIQMDIGQKMIYWESVIPVTWIYWINV